MKKPIDPSIPARAAGLASSAPGVGGKSAMERFLDERASRRNRGLVGFCKRCGRPDPEAWTLFCRRRTCRACREKSRDHFGAWVLGIVSDPYLYR